MPAAYFELVDRISVGNVDYPHRLEASEISDFYELIVERHRKVSTDHHLQPETPGDIDYDL